MNNESNNNLSNPLSILLKALVDSFRPRMLMLTLVAVGLAAIFWLVLIWFSIDPLYKLAVDLLAWAGLDVSLYSTAEPSFMGLVKAVIVPLFVFGLMWPLVATSAVLLAGLYVTPPVVNYISQRDFPQLGKRGDTGWIRSLWVALKAVLVFLIAWVITLPLWLIPGMAFVLPILLTAYLLMTVMRFDALAAHATLDEIHAIRKQDSSSAWLIGIVCAFLSFVPPILLIMPVMSALAFTRHYMLALDQLRSRQIAISSTVTF